MNQPRIESFVPLAAALAQGKASPQRGSGDVSGQRFKPLEQPQAPAQPSQPGAKRCEPAVSVQRAGDRVVSIRVQCACGEVIDLACVYPEAAGQAES